jgi:8-oxo-dGTP pyrophosphatase MutT (NUDIX family)
LAQSVLSEQVEELRKAASLVIVRDGQTGLEVLVMKRTKDMRFLPGFLSFPGGSLDETDDAMDDKMWAYPLSNVHQVDDSVYAVGALRETVEETGGLLAVCDERGAETDGVVDAEVQEALLGESLSYPALLTRLRLQINGRNLRFVGRWITPPFMPKRFDTRFFVTVTRGQTENLRVNPAENEWVKWCVPTDLLGDIEEKRAKAAPPTIAMLKALARYAKAAVCFADLNVPGPDPNDPALRVVLNDL